MLKIELRHTANAGYGSLPDILRCGSDVRFGSKADICAAKSDVRFTPNSDRKSVFPHKVMSALPPKADMYSALAYVCFGPIADIACSEMREAANGGIVQIVIFLA